MRDTTVSVIVPVYRAERTLARCVRSILGQTHENLQLLLIDDGSPDECPALCDAWAREDPRVLALHQPNAGAGAARNHGLAHATGAYIAFVDSDDFVRENYLARMLEVSLRHGCDIVQCGFEAGEGEAFSRPPVPGEPVFVPWRQAMNDRRYKVSVWGKLYSAQAVRGKAFAQGLIYEDDGIYYQFLYGAQRVALISDALYYYYQSAQSVMRGAGQVKLDFIPIYQQRIAYFEALGEAELVRGSHARFCFVIAAYYGELYAIDPGHTSLDMLRRLFLAHFPQAAGATGFPAAYWAALYAFRLSPALCSRALRALARKG